MLQMAKDPHIGSQQIANPHSFPVQSHYIYYTQHFQNSAFGPFQCFVSSFIPKTPIPTGDSINNYNHHLFITNSISVS